MEEILDYAVEIDVLADGWLQVTERIRVRALGREIRRGIYRDFPTRFPRQSGIGRVTAPFRVLSVERDGAPEPWTTLSVGGPAGRGGIRVRIGDPDVLVPVGEHTYALTYRTTRWLVFGDDRDVLYWNVTGNGWSFPIRRASASVGLPGPTSAGDLVLEGWTGPEGATTAALTTRFEPEAAPHGRALFETTGALGPREGLTVRLTFPRGLVAPPTEAQRSAWFRMDWGPYIDAALVVALVTALYLWMWVRVGRDPRARSTVIRYEPPEGYSASELGFVRRRGYHPSQLTAALVDLAVKGALHIGRDGRKWHLRATGEAADALPPDEKRLLLGIYPSGRGSLVLGGTSNPRVRKAAKKLRADLKRRLEREYFVTNRGWFVAGLAAALLGFVALTVRARFAISPEGWFMGLWLTFWTMGLGTLLVRVRNEWAQALSGDSLAWVTAIFITLFSLPFLGAEIFVGYLLYQAVPNHLALAAAALGGVNVLFYHLLERPTLKGRGLLDRLDGFAAFLTATEEDRVRRLQPAERSLELFERWLPFAIALGVESAWADRFGDALDAPEARAGAGGASPAWFAGSGGFSASGLSTSLGAGLASSLSASSASPSSGGGGGGSSGGGGGGGGGGGW